MLTTKKLHELRIFNHKFQVTFGYNKKLRTGPFGSLKWSVFLTENYTLFGKAVLIENLAKYRKKMHQQDIFKFYRWWLNLAKIDSAGKKLKNFHDFPAPPPSPPPLNFRTASCVRATLFGRMAIANICAKFGGSGCGVTFFNHNSPDQRLWTGECCSL